MNTLVNYHFLDIGQSYTHYDSERSAFQEVFGHFLLAEPGIAGRVLDIGCGHSINPTLKKILPQISQLDGVDPFPVLEPPAHLSNRWTCPLERIPVQPNTYDMAYSYNVVEHVKNISAFLSKAIEVLRRGGVYWSMSPNASHPFTWATRVAQAAKIKSIYQKRVNQLANDYPAYYQLSNNRRILNTINRLALPIEKIDFYYLPCVHWDTYFPESLRAIPHLIDRILLLRQPMRSFIFMFRLQKQSL